MLDICCVPTSYDEYCNECQLSVFMLLLGNLATAVCCAKVLFQPNFLVSFNALPGVLHAEWSTKRTTEPDTAQTERVLTRLVDTASLDSRLHQSSKRVFHNIHVLSMLFLARVARTTLRGTLASHFAQGGGAVGRSTLIHGSTLCRQLKSCLRDWSISRMKPCRQDNDKVQRNKRWQQPNNVSSSYPQEAVHLHRQLESSTRAIWTIRRCSLVSHRNGQPGNSRSRRLRVRPTQE